jgi:hypothetical protein
MNTKRFVLAGLGSFVFVFLFEMLWHGYFMRGLYNQTISVWRPENESNMASMVGSHFLFAMSMALMYTFVGKHLKCKVGIQYGILTGLILAMPQLGTYCYLPIPLVISLLWMLAALLKCLGAGMAIARIYKEK